MQRRKISHSQKGFIILTGTILTFIMVPMVGLAVDAAFLYTIKSRLSAAVDAASLSAARSLAVGLTMAQQESSARDRARAFFDANYTPSAFHTTLRSINIDVAETGYRTRNVTVTASVDAPLYFMRLIWPSPTTVVTAEGRASRRDVNVIMVLDRSASMNSNGGCVAMRQAANGFVNLFANERDRLGMITYGVSYAINYAPSFQFKTSSPSLSQVIDTIHCQGGTGSAQALYKGYEQIVGLGEPGALNVILYFTDGIPNTVTANYPVNVLDTARVADSQGQPNAIANSRCYDWENGQRWFGAPGVPNANWNPANQVFRGAIFAEGNRVYGVEQHVTSNFLEPGPVTHPYPNASSTTQYTGGSVDDCWFRGGYGHNGLPRGTNNRAVQYDVAFYPDRDLYGTDLRSSDNYRSIVDFPAGHPYAGRIDVRSTQNLNNAAINALDNVGKRIRSADLNPNISTVVYVIGLGDQGDDQHTLLRRVANDPLSPIYDSSKAEGMYIHAPTAADLGSAFSRIASEVLRFAM